MKKVITKNENETKDLAFKIAQGFLTGGVLGLSGNLGSGKTTFAKGFAKGLGIKEKIISPTFLIIKQYKIPNKKNFFYHIDLYRLEDIDLVNSGLFEILTDPENIVLIEWVDKISNSLLNNTKIIKLNRRDKNNHELETNF